MPIICVKYCTGHTTRFLVLKSLAIRRLLANNYAETKSKEIPQNTKNNQYAANLYLKFQLLLTFIRLPNQRQYLFHWIRFIVDHIRSTFASWTGHQVSPDVVRVVRYFTGRLICKLDRILICIFERFGGVNKNSKQQLPNDISHHTGIGGSPISGPSGSIK